jgi:hypothetical protein
MPSAKYGTRACAWEILRIRIRTCGGKLRRSSLVAVRERTVCSAYAEPAFRRRPGGFSYRRPGCLRWRRRVARHCTAFSWSTDAPSDSHARLDAHPGSVVAVAGRHLGERGSYRIFRPNRLRRVHFDRLSVSICFIESDGSISICVAHRISRTRIQVTPCYEFRGCRNAARIHFSHIFEYDYALGFAGFFVHVSGRNAVG